MELSIIIITYKERELLRTALSAVLASQTVYNFEVIVVDSDSQDGTIAMVEQEFMPRADHRLMKLIKNRNEGFGRGNNRAIPQAMGDYILLLNADTKVDPDTIQVMMDFMRARPEVGIATCKLVKANGELDLACRRSFPAPAVAFYRLSGLSKLFPKNKKFGAYNLTYKDPNQETEIDACAGAFMLMSRPCLSAVKGFDEDFYMYGEDIDLCYRAKQAGWKVWYYPNTKTIHYKGQAARQSADKSLYAFYDSMWIFYNKHYRQTYGPLLTGLVYFGRWLLYYQQVLANLVRPEKYVSK